MPPVLCESCFNPTRDSVWSVPWWTVGGFEHWWFILFILIDRRQDRAVKELENLFVIVWFMLSFDGIEKAATKATHTLGVIRICSLLFRELLSLGCTYVQNLCGYHQEELMRIPKHPQLVKFGWFWAKLWHFEKRDVLR